LTEGRFADDGRFLLKGRGRELSARGREQSARRREQSAREGWKVLRVRRYAAPNGARKCACGLYYEHRTPTGLPSGTLDRRFEAPRRKSHFSLHPSRGALSVASLALIALD